MGFAFILIVVFSIASTLLLVLFLRERKKISVLKKKIIGKFDSISEGLGRVSSGNLNAKIDSIPIPFADRDVFGALERIGKNFNEITIEPLKRFCYVGTDAWLEGSQCAEILGERMKPGSRILIVVTSNRGVFIMNQRSRSFIETLAVKYPALRLFGVFESMTDPNKAREYVKQVAQDIDAVYVTGNSMAPATAQGLEDAGRAGKVFVLCHDLDPPIVSDIKRGSISASLVCSTIEQGRDTVIHLFNHIVSGWRPIQPRLMCKQVLVDVTNLSQYWDVANNTLLETSELHATNLVPLKASAKRLKLIAFVEDWNNAFQQMILGLKKGASMLASFNAELVLHTINQVKRPKDEVVRDVASILASEAERGLDGIVAFVGIPELIPILNRMAEKGIPVATFNSEPRSLRSLIQWLVQGSVEFARFGDEYESGHREISTAMRDMLNTITKMVERAQSEAETAKSGAEAVAQIMELIESTSRAEEAQFDTVSAQAEIGEKLSGMVDFFNERVNGLKAISENVEKTGTKIETMGAYSEKIRSIIGLIDDIAAQTNLLAFNAAIEASRAGESGKGFKVIAAEIRNLADKSVVSTRDVSTLIANMLIALDESVKAVETTKRIAADQVLSITEAADKLKDLSSRLIDTMERVKDAARRNSEKIRGMKESALGMDLAVEKTAQISTQNSIATEAIGGAFTEISSEFEEMIKRTKQLGEMILVLKGSISQFTAE